jgi:hypothetical protein
VVSRRGFSSTQPAGTRPPPLALESALALAEVDISLSQLYVAASQAVGETSSRTSPEAFRRAVTSTRTTLDDLQVPTGKLGFAEVVPHISSGNPKQAADTFRQEANVAAEAILDQTEAQVRKGLSSIGRQKDRIVEAFSHLDQLTELATPLADLLRRAWERLLSALKTLKQIVAAITNEEAAEYLSDLIADVSFRGCLKKVVGDGRVREQLINMQFMSSLNEGAIDRKTEEVEAVGRRFAKVARKAMAIAAVAAVIAPLFAAHIASPVAAPLAVPATYALGIIAVLAMARDYLHSGHLNSGQGISAIIGELAERKSTQTGGLHDSV